MCFCTCALGARVLVRAGGCMAMCALQCVPVSTGCLHVYTYRYMCMVGCAQSHLHALGHAGVPRDLQVCLAGTCVHTQSHRIVTAGNPCTRCGHKPALLPSVLQGEIKHPIAGSAAIKPEEMQNLFQDIHPKGSGKAASPCQE